MIITKTSQDIDQSQIYPKGTHPAYLYQIIYLGTQITEWEGSKIANKKVRFTFEFPTLKAEFNGEVKPRVLSTQDLTLSLSDKAKLTPIAEALTGLTSDELNNFDLDTLVGKECLVTIIHKVSNGKTYANIGNIASMMVGMKMPEAQFNENKVFDYADNFDAEHFSNLPQFLQDKMSLSPEYANVLGLKPVDMADVETSGLNGKLIPKIPSGEEIIDTTNYSGKVNPDDIPF